jgi:hypothetical protein
LKLAIAQAMYLGGLDIVEIAIPLTPVEFGNLRREFHVAEPADILSNGLVMKIWNSQNYAVYVHERLELKHKEGQAKFLEAAIIEARGWWKDRLLKRTMEALHGGS